MVAHSQPEATPARAGLISLESLAAFSAIASLYTGDWGALRTLLQLLSLAAVAGCVLRDIGQPVVLFGAGSRSRAAAMLLALALCGFLLSTIMALASRGLSVAELGVAAVQVALPAMVLLSRARARLVAAIGGWAVAFALVDACANMLGVAGLLSIATPVRSIGGVVEFAYPGLSGSTLGAGFVAFIAICTLAVATTSASPWRWVAWLLLGILFASLSLIEARRYLGLALVALVIVRAWGPALKAGLPMITLGVAGLFLWLTFSASDADSGNVLRGLLMLNGIERATGFPLIGNGPTYIVQDEILSANFAELSAAGVTESQVLDLFISYGIASGLLFLAGMFLALGSAKPPAPWLPAVFLTTMGAELFFGGPLAGFAGAMLFFAAFGACLEYPPIDRRVVAKPTQRSIAASNVPG